MPSPGVPGQPGIRYPSIDGLRAFEAAARLGSFERAADELCITASAVSKRVATLEELLGTLLLQRSSKALALTLEGREYLAQVGAALGLLAAVPLHRRGTPQRQPLRLTTPPTFARQILVPELEAFTAAHPDIDLEVVLSIPYLGTSGSDADVEVQFIDSAGGGVATGAAAGGTTAGGREPLMHDVVLPMASPALLARLPAMHRPADLAAAPLLRTPLQDWSTWFRRAGLDWPEPESGPKLVDLGLTLEAAVGGQGVALARPSLARGWLASGALRPLFDLPAEPRQQYHLAHQSTAGEAPQALARWLRAVCERAASEGLALARAALSGGA